jgi:hypothetical protein
MKDAEVSLDYLFRTLFLTVCASTTDRYFMIYDSIFITIYI